jgi:hypothetical protein
VRQPVEQYAPPVTALREDAQQPNLFEHDKPRADGTGPIANRAAISARKDPVTSLLAAQDVTLSGARSEKKRELVSFLRTRREPMTSYEIAMALGWDRHAAARRLPDARGPASAHVAGGSRMSSHASARAYGDTGIRRILIGQEQPNLVCTIVASESTESERRLVKALKWLLEDSRRDDNREVA